MDKWEMSQLGDVAHLKMGQSPAGTLVTDLDSGLPFLQGNAEFGARYPAAMLQCDAAPRRSASGDSLISVRAPVGAINRSDREYGIGRGLAAVMFDTVDSDFGHHALVERSRELYAVSQGTTFSAIGRADLAALEFPVPPLEEQRRIAEVLDTIDETIEAAENVVAKLTSTLREALRSALNDTTPNSRHSTVEREFELATGITLNAARVPRSNPVRYLRVANVQRGYIDTTDLATLEATTSEVSRKALAAGDLLVVEGHASPSEIGRCAIVPCSAEGLLFQNHLFRLRPRAITPEVAQLILNGEEARAYWRRMCSTSSGLHTINSSMLRAMPISVPRRDHQRLLLQIMRASDESLETELTQLAKLRQLRSGLAADLVSGRVRTVAA